RLSCHRDADRSHLPLSDRRLRPLSLRQILAVASGAAPGLSLARAAFRLASMRHGRESWKLCWGSPRGAEELMTEASSVIGRGQLGAPMAACFGTRGC